MIFNTTHMEYITFYTMKRTTFDILAYFWPELSGMYLHLNRTCLIPGKVSTPENYSYLHRLPLNRVESQWICGELSTRHMS